MTVFPKCPHGNPDGALCPRCTGGFMVVNRHTDACVVGLKDGRDCCCPYGQPTPEPPAPPPVPFLPTDTLEDRSKKSLEVRAHLFMQQRNIGGGNVIANAIADFVRSELAALPRIAELEGELDETESDAGERIDALERNLADAVADCQLARALLARIEEAVGDCSDSEHADVDDCVAARMRDLAAAREEIAAWREAMRDVLAIGRSAGYPNGRDIHYEMCSRARTLLSRPSPATQRIARMREKGHEPPTEDEAQSTLNATLHGHRGQPHHEGDDMKCDRKNFNLVCKCEGQVFALRITTRGTLVAVCDWCGETKRMRLSPPRSVTPRSSTGSVTR